MPLKSCLFILPLLSCKLRVPLNFSFHIGKLVVIVVGDHYLVMTLCAVDIIYYAYNLCDVAVTSVFCCLGFNGDCPSSISLIS